MGIWFHRTFADSAFSAGTFVPPPDPASATKALHEELARLRTALDETRSQAEKEREAAQAEARARMSAEERAAKERDDRTLWEQLANEAETAKAALLAHLQTLQTAAAQAPLQATTAIVAQAEHAAAKSTSTGVHTRAHRRTTSARGWEVDRRFAYSAGTRPAKAATSRSQSGRRRADRPTTRCSSARSALPSSKPNGNKNVSAHVDQAQRYARRLRFDGGAEAIAGP